MLSLDGLYSELFLKSIVTANGSTFNGKPMFIIKAKLN